jgi:hypothetical protein
MSRPSPEDKERLERWVRCRPRLSPARAQARLAALERQSRELDEKLASQRK